MTSKSIGKTLILITIILMFVLKTELVNNNAFAAHAPYISIDLCPTLNHFLNSVCGRAVATLFCHTFTSSRAIVCTMFSLQTRTFHKTFPKHFHI